MKIDSLDWHSSGYSQRKIYPPDTRFVCDKIAAVGEAKCRLLAQSCHSQRQSKPAACDPIETFETLASPAKVWVFKLSGIHRKINLVKSGKQEHRD
jgi:hypothetical protein